MFENIKLLHVCKQDKATSLQRRMAFYEIGLQKDTVFSYLLNKKLPLYKKLWNKIIFKLNFYPEYNNENKQIIKCVLKTDYDIIFIEKGLSIKAKTLQRVKSILPKCKIISYTLDDMMNPNNNSIQYKKAIQFYDFNFTNKKYNVQELEELGAKNVYYFKNSYCSKVHRPISLTDEEKKYYGSDVSFIGTYEEQRKEALKFLADAGIRIKVWGWGKKYEFIYKNIEFMSKHVYGDEYPKVVCASKINLCFLRKANRDTETTRSVELPACGGFMLAERTKEHAELFVEKNEAEFFDSNEELLQKVKYYLENEPERKKIAQNGYNKCITAKYNYKNQLLKIISIVTNEK